MTGTVWESPKLWESHAHVEVGHCARVVPCPGSEPATGTYPLGGDTGGVALEHGAAPGTEHPVGTPWGWR